MDTPPIPKPRTNVLSEDESIKKPVPKPRTKVTINNDKVSATVLLRSLSSVSKQISEDVALKVSSSAKTANEKFEKTFNDGSRFAKGTFERTLSTSRAVRDSVTKSVIKSTKNASLKLGLSNKPNDTDENDANDVLKRASMPDVDISFFDNIQFHSPFLEQKRLKNHSDMENLPSTQLNASHLDDISLFSNNSDSYVDTVSNFSCDSRENDNNECLANTESDLTYDTPNPSRTNSIASDRFVFPEVPRRRNRVSSPEVMRQNSLYENWTLPCASSSQVPELSPRPSKSTIYEFDPLNQSPTQGRYEGISNENLLVEYFLVGDTYGTIIATDTSNDDLCYDFYESDYFNPPTPPERFDSLLPNETLSDPALQVKKTSCWYDEDPLVSPNAETKPSGSMMQRFSTMLKFDKGINKGNKQRTEKVEIVQRPVINNLPVQYYSGIINKVASGKVEDLFKNSQSRFCVLTNKKLMCYTDPTNSILKESYALESITALQIVLPLSSSTTSNSYCFELMISNGIKTTPTKVLFSCGSAPDRRNWAQKISEHLINSFPNKYTTEFTRCGWCYLKEGVSGEWRGAWIMLIRRVLVYSVTTETTRTVDLRKTRCVVTRDPDENTKIICPSDGSPNLLLDCPDVTLYLRFQHDRDLKGWKYMLKLAAHNNGAEIHHQQLTKNDVPTLVDKCINFIYSHGSLSDGIYRRAGSNVVLSELLARFRRDAWSVQLIPGQHSEHDVAGVLKRFFRDLPDSLIPQEKRAQYITATDVEDERKRHTALKQLLSTEPLVVFNTMKKLFAHLHFIDTMSHANKMSAYNLAAVWAPTIMPTAVSSTNIEAVWSTKELNVVRELIVNYEAVFEPTEDEIKREAAVRGILTRIMKSTGPTPPTAAGDLRVWVYINDRSNCYQIPLTPNKTCSDVCIELCQKANSESHLLMLEEVICNSMRRIIHLDEVVLDVVLRWGYWDEEDRKENYLLLKDNKILNDIDSLRSSSVAGELRVANETSKAFKQYMFEFKNGALCYFKDKQCTHKIEEWKVKDILWYVGYEPKRNPQSPWAITFIPRENKQKRSKERPWFGTTIAGAVAEEQIKWMAAMMCAEHTHILPTPRLVIT